MDIEANTGTCSNGESNDTKRSVQEGTDEAKVREMIAATNRTVDPEGTAITGTPHGSGAHNNSEVYDQSNNQNYNQNYDQEQKKDKKEQATGVGTGMLMNMDAGRNKLPASGSAKANGCNDNETTDVGDGRAVLIRRQGKRNHMHKSSSLDLRCMPVDNLLKPKHHHNGTIDDTVNGTVKGNDQGALPQLAASANSNCGTQHCSANLFTTTTTTADSNFSGCNSKGNSADNRSEFRKHIQQQTQQSNRAIDPRTLQLRRQQILQKEELLHHIHLLQTKMTNMADEKVEHEISRHSIKSSSRAVSRSLANSTFFDLAKGDVPSQASWWSIQDSSGTFVTMEDF